MASLITTMFVSPPMRFALNSSTPLTPVSTLEQSLSCIHLDAFTARDPQHLEGFKYNEITAGGKELAYNAFDHVSTGSPFHVSNSNSRARAPFRPQKANRGTSTWQLRQFAEATLGSGSLRKAVKLPEGEDINEWLAVNVVDFYNQINLLYGSITEFCSPQTCPEMKATDEFEYLWQDSDNFKRPTKMPAPEYIEHLMAWCQSNIDNEQMFPSRIGVPFPKAFPALLRQMFKRLYRVYAHIYCHHYPVVIQLGLEPHLNTSFKHYVLFVDEHGLASGKDFWGPLGDLVESMLKSD